MVLIGSSYLLGAVVLRQVSLNSFLIGSLLSLTFGMILYIGLFEFLPLIKETKDKKNYIHFYALWSSLNVNNFIYYKRHNMKEFIKVNKYYLITIILMLLTFILVKNILVMSY